MILLQPRRGFALVAAIFGLMVIGLMTAGAWTLTELDTTASKNRVDGAVALRLAHTAEAHARSLLADELKSITYSQLLKGYDNTQSTSDDGLLINYAGLGDSLKVPSTGITVTGAGKYYVTVVNDPSESSTPYADANSKIRLRCRGVSNGGSSAEINLVMGNYSLPGSVFNGSIEIAAATHTSGDCGTIHANGSITGSNGQASGPVSATGTISNSLPNMTPKTQGAPSITVPDLNPADYCGPTSSEYVYIPGPTGTPEFGTWNAGSKIWTVKLRDHVMAAGKYGNNKIFCVSGNVVVNNNETASMNLSFIASGYISVTGSQSSNVTAMHPTGLLFMAGTDLVLGDNGTYTGVIYARSQCQTSAAFTLYGQFICFNKADDNTSIYDKHDIMKLGGNSNIIFNCSSFLSSANGVVAWYPTVGK
jgi:hypothetical protein